MKHLDWTLTFIDIALATGARRGELLALEWADIDWLAATLSISKSIEQTVAGRRVKRRKNGHTRKFRLGQTAIASLRFLQEHQQQNRRLVGAGYQGDLVFSKPDGSRLLPDLVSQAIVRCLRKARIKDTALHTLRHDFCCRVAAVSPTASAKGHEPPLAAPHAYVAFACQRRSTSSRVCTLGPRIDSDDPGNLLAHAARTATK